MAYATSAQVQSEFKSITFSASTAVTSDEVTEYLSAADAEINARISPKYSTPVTGTESVTLLAMIEIWLVKHRIQERLKVATGDSKTSQEGSNNYRQMALDMLKDIAAGMILLTDADLATSADGVRSYTSDNSDDDDTQFTFERGVDQW